MAKVSDLNVRFGLIFDEKALGQAERSLRRAGDRLTKVGNEMMTGLTLPLGLFGASAIKAAGDLESLTLALKTQAGSTSAATAELEKLTMVARNPGLSLEETIRASVRLQSVGIEADRARGIITQLGNAIAASGGTSQQFEGVTRQFAQMISKGRILQEDMTIIAENMPIISELMDKAFGTRSVDQLQKMGVTADDFITKITQAAETLPRVESGIKNNISNALDEMRISLGKVGLAIEKSFNVSGNLSAFAEWLSSVAAAFSSLNPTVQSAILYFGALLVAIGPIAKVIGNIQLVSSLLVSGWASVVSVGKSLIASVLSLRSAILALNIATQAFIGIGLAVAVFMLADYFGAFNRELTTAEQKQKTLNEITIDAKKAIIGERSEVDKLITTLQSETSSRQQKEEALKRLQEINPKYFGNLKIENGLVSGLKESYDNYSESLLRNAKIQASKERLISVEKQLLDIDLERQDKLEEYKRVQGAFYSEQLFNESQYGKYIAEQKKPLQDQLNTIKQLIYQEEVRAGIIKAAPPRDFSNITGLTMESTELQKNSLLYKLSAESVNKATTAKTTFKKATGDTTEETKKNTKAQKELNDELEKTAGIQSKPIPNFEPIPTLPTPTGVQSENQPQAPDFSGILDSTDLFYKKQLEDQKKQKERLKEEWTQLAVDAVYALDQLFGAFEARQLATLEKSYKAQLLTAGDSATKRAAIEAEYEAKREELQKKAGKRKKAFAMAEAAMNTAVAITKTYSEFGFPIGLPLAIAQGALGAAQIAMIAATPFAKGTQFAPGGMALVGEQGPELMNVPRGSQILSNNRTNRALEGINSQANISGEFTVRGTDLVLVLEKAQSKQKRIF
ncbi:MAG: tape measure protein [Saprospiraceae bacterium]